MKVLQKEKTDSEALEQRRVTMARLTHFKVPMTSDVG